MQWTSHAFLIISKFFMGYGAGFTAVIGLSAQVMPSELTLFNIGIYPCLSGLVTVFPQLTKTFAEAAQDRMK